MGSPVPVRRGAVCLALGTASNTHIKIKANTNIHRINIPYKTPQPSPGVFCVEGDLGLSLFFDKLEDNQQHNCAKEGGQQASNVKAGQHIGAAAHQADQPATEHCADDTNDDVGQCASVFTFIYHLGCQPAGKTTDDKPYKYSHS